MEFIREMEAGAELNANEIISANDVFAEQSESHLSIPGTENGGPSKRRKSRSSFSSRRSSRRSSIRSNRSGRLRVQKAISECRPLLEGDEESAMMEPPKEMGGTILGIHNLAIVSPQFIVSFRTQTEVMDVRAYCLNYCFLPQTAIVAAIIFKISELTSQSPYRKAHGIESGADVVWVLRFGGVMTLVSVFLSRYVPAPPSETMYIEALKYASNVRDEDDDDNVEG